VSKGFVRFLFPTWPNWRQNQMEKSLSFLEVAQVGISVGNGIVNPWQMINRVDWKFLPSSHTAT